MLLLDFSVKLIGLSFVLIHLLNRLSEAFLGLVGVGDQLIEARLKFAVCRN